MTLPELPPTDAGGPIEGTAVAERGRFALPEDPNRRALTLGAIVLGVLLFLFVASRLLLGGGEEPIDDSAAPAQPEATTSTTALPVLDGGTAESFEVFSTKNPFTPLINPPSGGGTSGGPASGGGASSGGTSGGSGSTATTLGGGSSGGGTSGGGSSGGGTSGGGNTTSTTRSGGASGGSANEPRRQQRVALLDVLRRNGRLVAQVRVGDTVYTAGEGDVFADNYRVLSIDETNECGRFIFGDEQFRLCRGEETLK